MQEDQTNKYYDLLNVIVGNYVTGLYNQEKNVGDDAYALTDVIKMEQVRLRITSARQDFG